MEVCVGMIGMSLVEFWDASPIEINFAMGGFQEFHSSGEPEPMDRGRLEELMELYPD